MSSADTLAQAANRLALAAVILGAGAFIVSALQALLEYVTASEERSKCNSSAIDISEKLKYWTFSPRHWKPKFFYPELDLTFNGIIKQLVRDDRYGIDRSPMAELVKKPEYALQAFMPSQNIGKKAICDGVTRLVKNADGKSIQVTTKDLSWSLYLRWRWWLFRHPSLAIRRPRATWAQLLRAFGLRETSGLLRRHVDASVIPRDLDVPIQRVKLFELGNMAMLLGFTDIEIKLKERKFTATGPFAAITTEDLQNFGKVIRFEGDPFAIANTILRFGAQMLALAPNPAIGQFSVGRFATDGRLLPLDILCSALEGRKTFEEYVQQSGVWLREQNLDERTIGNLSLEASLFERLLIKAIWPLGTSSRQRPSEIDSTNPEHASVMRNKMNSAIRNWQTQNGSAIPTIFAATCFTGLPGICQGFPSRLLLQPYLGWTRIIAKDLVSRVSDTFVESKTFQDHLARGNLNFVRETSRYLMSHDARGLTRRGVLCWGFSPLDEVFDSLPLEVQCELLGCERGKDETEPLKFQALTPNQVDADKLTVLLMPQAVSLLKTFQPREWIAVMNNRDRLTVGLTWRPENLIWAQVAVLDLTIHLLLHRYYGESPDGRPASPQNRTRMDEENMKEIMRKLVGIEWRADDLRIVRSVVESSKLRETELSDAPSDEPLEWNLVRALKEHSNLPSEGEQAERRLKKLSDLLKLRSIFHIAFLMVNPDSTDVFLAEGSEVEMPMI